jgi:hypothetical protein
MTEWQPTKMLKTQAERDIARDSDGKCGFCDSNSNDLALEISGAVDGFAVPE